MVGISMGKGEKNGRGQASYPPHDHDTNFCCLGIMPVPTAER
ncbi:hypothetical protein RISK_004816 [Rhodopirellula islandica]|uniref:Uncharacterized protein n=1 Tax=Rhodopirellula islandica TaxID=595434 RepID=A0A0J1B8Y6_RHOIS|nr:hypothetical protein RISK_004816 [Rhodopirellula islandica]